VRVVLRDADGDTRFTINSTRPANWFDEYVQVTRPQGTTATLRIYIDNVLQKEQRV
jgi:hypothetical protein